MSYARPTSDLESYAALYRGRSKIKRLQYIARQRASLSSDALELAIKAALQGRDTVLYKALVAANKGVPDDAWVAKQDAWATEELGKLRRELEEFKEQNSRETIRSAHMDLGDFYHARGKLQQARGEYIKSRDHCVQPAHNLAMCLRTIVVSIESGDYANVDNYQHMAENASPDPATNFADLALVRASAGLAQLVRGRYKEAALRFLAVPTSDASEERTAALQAHFGEPLALEDVATLGALCALATLDRAQLKTRVLENEPFCALLELVPDVRELVRDFYASRYTKCLQTLDALHDDLLLDVYVGPEGHVERLYHKIRQEALVQYVSPFLSADLVRMQTVFNTTAAKLDSELYALIESGAIPARIDTQKRALFRKPQRSQAQVLEHAVLHGQQAFIDIEAMLLRMSLVKNGLTLPASPNFQSRPPSVLGARSGSINSIADSGFERFGGAG